jgi:sterol desaturase/sphingolipid hydroxylase (fatty acid hydroxylase superfamily)
MLWSPNAVWLVMSAVVYCVFPYDLDPRTSTARGGPIAAPFLWERVAVWAPLIAGYYAFWHVTVNAFCSRPMVANRRYRAGRVLHNAFYSAVGIAIFVVLENIMCFLWVSGAVPFISDDELRYHMGVLAGSGHNEVTAADSFRVLLWLFVAALAIPLWRDAHFYFAHRLLHFRPLFRYVHSLHHRNTDVEPFAGLCMHPIEHIYYYTSALLSFALPLSPFHFLYNGAHFMLAPAASHSGFEDHWQADPFHYFHHRYFEVNYAGLACSFLDNWFGSFCGGPRPDDIPPLKPRDDAKATLDVIRSPPTGEHCIYLLLSAACVGLWCMTVCRLAGGEEGPPPTLAADRILLLRLLSPTAIAWIAGAGPVVVAAALCVIQDASVICLVRPFQRRGVLETGAHFFIGVAVCVLPVVFICRLSLESLLRPPGGAAAFA